MSKTSKMSKKEYRQAQIMKIILESGQIPTAKQLKENYSFNTSERTLGRDIIQICESFPDIEIESLRKALFNRINERIRNQDKPMVDKNLISILGFFLSKKQEIETRGDQITRYEFVVVEPDGKDDSNNVATTSNSVDNSQE